MKINTRAMFFLGLFAAMLGALVKDDSLLTAGITLILIWGLH